MVQKGQGLKLYLEPLESSLDDDDKSVIDRVVLVQSLLFTDWTKQLIQLDYSSVPGVFCWCCCAESVIEAISIAVRFVLR